MQEFEARFTRWESPRRYISAPVRLRADGFNEAYQDALTFLSGMKAGGMKEVEILSLRNAGVNPSQCVESVDLIDIWGPPAEADEAEA